ncbi:MAG: diacylglycerol kinase family protein [Actinomycetota bacterium]
MQRALLVVNTKAGSYSPRNLDLAAGALSAEVELQVGITTGRDHATELARAAVESGFDAVVSLGGDGTLNEVAQPLVGTGVALGVLPGGQTNVMARSLGIPTDLSKAAALVAASLRTRTTRRLNVGQAGARYFLVAAGMGLDAEVIKRAEADPEGKRRWGEWSFLSKALRTGGDYRRRSASMTVVADGRSERVVFAICANVRPLTYFKRWGVDALPLARLDAGLDVIGLTRVTTGTIPRLAWAVFVSRSTPRWETSRYFHDVIEARFTADEPMPVEVDGDYIGERTEVPLRLVPEALDVIVPER